jgi:hypothetical protein
MARYQCTVSGCTNEAVFDDVICEECLVNAHEKSIENMGKPERYLCGHCGVWFDADGMAQHMYTLNYES